jgi:hypothetical protein
MREQRDRAHLKGPTVMSLQLDKFHNVDRLVGITVNMPRHCQCGNDMLHVGPGRGPHRASLQCAQCGRHCGWLSHKTANFLADVIDRFGKPVAPVHVRCASDTAMSTVPHIHAEEPPENAGTSKEEK